MSSLGAKNERRNGGGGVKGGWEEGVMQGGREGWWKDGWEGKELLFLLRCEFIHATDPVQQLRHKVISRFVTLYEQVLDP